MDLPVSVINGRFKVLERPDPAPGHCAVCGSVSKPVVDFDMTVDYYGAVLLCVDCIREAYVNIGLLHPDLLAPAQATPLFNGSTLDVGTVHEYLAASLESTRRLIAILPDSDLSVEDDENSSAGTEDDAEQSHGTNADDSESLSIERSYDLPTITGRTVRSIFDDD